MIEVSRTEVERIAGQRRRAYAGQIALLRKP